MSGVGIKMDKRVMAQILEHVRKNYPHECCGVMVGDSYDNKFVIEAYEVPNINKERARDRYVMDPNQLAAIDNMLRGRKKEILGFYHSHPDNPARPSEFDREHAWPVYSYVIVECTKGKTKEARSWVMDESSSRFREETLLVI